MTLRAIPVPGKAKSVDICNAFIAGAPKSAEGAVLYGVDYSNLAEWKQVLASGEDYWFIDNSYFDKTRGLFFRATKNRLQHTGLGQSDGVRFKALDIPILPWRGLNNAPVVVIEQSDSFMEIHAGQVPRLKCGRPSKENESWAKFAAREHIKSGRKVRRRLWHPDKLKQQVRLAVDLDDAGLLIAHSSAAAVSALLAGVPIVVSETSCCWASLDTLPASRLRLFNVLADNQFTLTEMKNGSAWQALNP